MADVNGGAPEPQSATTQRWSGWTFLRRLPGQLLGRNPFQGDCLPAPIPLFSLRGRRPSLPFPHPWNYREPIRILDTYFHGADAVDGAGRHNRYLNVIGFPPVLITRDPGIIRAITTDTGDRPGQFDRDTLPSTGIARATGRDTLLFSNGPLWRHQRRLAASPFGKTTLFQPEMFQEFELTFRRTVSERLAALTRLLERTHQTTLEVMIEPEIKVIMLEMLVNNFFGADVCYQDLRDVHVPAIERLIDHIVRDTVINRAGVPLRILPGMSQRLRQARADFATFDQLTSLVLATRQEGRGLWKQFRSEAPDAALRSNVKVFLAGALEATTSYACWAISHLARNPDAQEKVFADVHHVESYSPDNLNSAGYLHRALEETLRLTPSLYFLPRRATQDTWVQTSDGRRMMIPAGTHILLDVWHANRHEDHWGMEATGFPAVQFAPERWDVLASKGVHSKDMLHFGFGHGPRVCPGKHLGQLEVGLVVGSFVKKFRFRAVHQENPERAGVSTKPRDGVLLNLQLR